MQIIAIDPGSTQSAACVVDFDTLMPMDHMKLSNAEVLYWLRGLKKLGIKHQVVIERIASYGMPVGREVFDTCEWVGRFTEAIESGSYNTVRYITRAEEKAAICHSPKANDATIRRALIDRFAKHDLKNGKGTKSKPDWFYGFKADEWAAYAVAVTYHDMLMEDAHGMDKVGGQVARA